MINRARTIKLMAACASLTLVAAACGSDTDDAATAVRAPAATDAPAATEAPADRGSGRHRVPTATDADRCPEMSTAPVTTPPEPR